MRAYPSCLTSFRDVSAAVKQYKSHRKTLESEATEKKYKPYERKKELLKKKFDKCFLEDETVTPAPAPFQSNYDAFVRDFAEAFQMLDEEYEYNSDFNVDFENLTVDI